MYYCMAIIQILNFYHDIFECFDSACKPDLLEVFSTGYLGNLFTYKHVTVCLALEDNI